MDRARLGRDSWPRILLLALVCLLSLSLPLPALAKADWTAKSSVLPAGEDYLGITYGNGLLVTVTRTGNIFTSPDGESWSAQGSGTSHSLISVRYLGGQFVAVGQFGTILTSTDGKAWKSRSNPASSWLYDVAYGADKYVVAGLEGILTSQDGVDWQLTQVLPKRWLSGVAYCGGSFAAVGEGGAVFTSPDGTKWSKVAETGFPLNSVTCGDGGRFVAVGGSGHVVVSKDGRTWQDSSTESTSAYYDVNFDGGEYVAVGNDGTIALSTDAQKWSVSGSDKTGTHSNLRRVVVALEKTWIVGNGATLFSSGLPAKRPPVVDLQFGQKAVPGSLLYGVAFGNETWVTVGADGVALTAKDGWTWTPAATIEGRPQLNALAYGGGLFAAVGGGGTIVTSPDGKVWTRRSLGTTKTLLNVTYDRGTFVAVGEQGLVVVSKDGITWTVVASPALQALDAVGYCNGKFIAVGFFGSTITSPDGLYWMAVGPSTNEQLTAVTCGDGRIVLLGTNGVALTSQDGLTWELGKTGVQGLPTAAAFGGGQFIAVGENGFVIASTDGQNWRTLGFAPTKGLLGLALAGDRFVGVGVEAVLTNSLLSGSSPLASSPATEGGTTPTPPPPPVEPAPKVLPSLEAVVTTALADLVKGAPSPEAPVPDPSAAWLGLVGKVGAALELSTDEASTRVRQHIQERFTKAPDRMDGTELALLTHALIQRADLQGALLVATQRLKVTPMDRSAYETYLTLQKRLALQEPFQVLVQGRRVQFDVHPVVLSGSTLVPLRAVGEALGATVQWDGAAQVVTLSREGTQVRLHVGDRQALVNNREIALDAAALIIDDRTMVPLRFLSETFGMKVTWMQEWQAIVITSAPLR